MAEIRAEVTRGTGCQHDGEMVWSSDDGSGSPSGCENGHVVVQGSKHRGDEACPDECKGIGEASGSCTGTEGYCEVDLARGLPSGTCHSVGAQTMAYSAMAPSTSWPPPGDTWVCSTGTGSCIESNHEWKGTRGPNGKRVCGATSSSTVGWGGEPNRAIDGTTHGSFNQASCTHTDNRVNADGSAYTGGAVAPPNWWQLDLGTPSLINHIDLWHRTDCCQDRLQTAKVYISDTPNYNTPGSNTRECGALSSFSNTPEKTICGSAMGPGQFVTVAHQSSDGGGEGIVSICEIKVWGVKGAIDPVRCPVP